MNKYMKWTLIALAIFAVLFAVGCAKTAVENNEELTRTLSVKSSGMAKPMMMQTDVAVESISMEPMPPRYYDGGNFGSGEEVDTETRIIRTAYMSVEVEDYFLASQKVEAFAKKYGGYVSSSDANADMNNKHSGTVTIRVPELHFDAAIAEITMLGELKSKNVNGNDVTEEYIDLQSRINNSKAHEKRLVAMYANATNVNDMMYIEQELSRVRGEIESMEGRLRYMSNRVEMSTITVNLYEEQPAVKEWGVWSSIKKSLNNSLATLRWMIELIGWLLPLLVVGTLIGLLVRWGVRKTKRK